MVFLPYGFVGLKLGFFFVSMISIAGSTPSAGNGCVAGAGAGAAAFFDLASAGVSAPVARIAAAATTVMTFFKIGPHEVCC